METDLKTDFTKLIDLMRDYDGDIDVASVRAAFEFALVAHADEKRLSGIPVIRHPLETALILASWKMDRDTIIAGLLHDTIEHGAATRKDILNAFGEDVLFLVEGLTKTSKLRLRGSEEEFFVENLRKMFLAIAKDLRIVFIRLAERIDNLKTVGVLPIKHRERYAKESIEIYSPLAERLGMWEVKTEIDELAFKFAYPVEFEKVKSLSSFAYKDAEVRITKMKNKLLAELEKQALTNVKVYGRKKSLYSLFNKLKRADIDWTMEKIYDIVALRILVPEVTDCYVALGVVYNIFKPVPGIALSDFISIPKPNGYRSIHTKVYGPGSKIAEVQIRTFEMHEEAEFGAAAHWRLSSLKSGGKFDSKSIDKGIWSASEEKLNWVKQLAAWQKELKDNEEFLKAVKFDALSRRIFVFSPKGDVFDLPADATPVDFAYAVHTDLGTLIKGAMVDGRIVPLNHKLVSGQIVQILKNKTPAKPNADWLGFVVTTLAKHEIKKQLNKNR